MATTTELENLVIRMSADVEGLLRGMAQVKDETKNSANQIENDAKRMEKNLKDIGNAAVGALAAFGAKGTLKDAFHEFSTAENIGIKLKAVLETNGRAVQETTEDYIDFANQLQKTTTMEDDATLSILKQAESFDLTGAAAKKAVKDAVAFAEINDSNAQSMIRLTAAMAKGDVERAMLFARMVPQLRGVRNETEFIERYQKLVASGMAVAGESANTAAGQIKQLENEYGNLKETIGETVSQGILPAIKWTKELVAWYMQLSEPVRTATTYLAGLSAVIVMLATVGPKAISMFVALRVAVVNFTLAAVTNPFVWIAGSIIAIGYMTAKVTGLTQAYRELGEAAEAMDKARGTMAGLGESQTGKIISNIEKSPAQTRPQLFNAEITKATQELNDYKDKLEQAKKDRDEWFVSMEQIRDALQHIKDYESSMQVLRDRIAALKEAMKGKPNEIGLDQAGSTKKMIEMVKAIREETEALAMNNFEQERAKAIKAGLTFDNASFVAREAKIRDTAKAYKQATDAVEDYIKALENENATLGMTEGEKKLYELKKAITDTRSGSAIDTSRIDVAEKMMKELELRTEELKQYESLQAKAAAIHEKFMSPEDKQAERITELDIMLAENMLTWEEYSKAVDEASQSLHEAAAAARDAAGAGSAEGMARLVEYASGSGGAITAEKIGQRNNAPKAQVAVDRRGEAGFPPRDPVKIENLLEEIARNTRKKAGNDIIFESADIG